MARALRLLLLGSALACEGGGIDRGQAAAPLAGTGGAVASPASSGTGAPAMLPGEAGATAAGSGSPPATTPANDAGIAGAPSAPSDAAAPPDLTHTFAEISIASGEEQTGVCQSWTIGNDQSLFVNRVVASNRGGFHHTNWIWVDEASYAGPDGTWPCAERGFDQIIAAAGGGVFFAQSTQALHDVQAFPEGVAFEVPPRARVIGDLHMLNAGDTALATDLTFDLYTLPAADVRVKLQPMAFTNTALEVAAGGESRARMQCAMPQPDFDIYYVLPHYHAFGRALRIDVAGGPMDGANVFTSDATYGDAWGETFEPPRQVRGALGLTLTCDYQNASGRVLGYGNGDGEMCVVLIYSTGAKAGGIALSNLTTTDVGGVHETDALCASVSTP